jgi:hypothetical protein
MSKIGVLFRALSYLKFRLHDFDNNTMLDGLEIFKALTHLLPYEEQDEVKQVDTRGKTVEEVMQERKRAEMTYYTGAPNHLSIRPHRSLYLFFLFRYCG